MPEIKLLNSFKSIPKGDAGKASVEWATGLRKFSVQADISSDSKSDIQR